MRKGGKKVGMTIQRMIELLEIEHECMLRGAHDDCDRDCANCELVQDDGDLHEMYTDVIALLKEQEAVKPNVSSAEQRCGNCNKVIEMDGWVACPWCGKPIAWNEWWNKNGGRAMKLNVDIREIDGLWCDDITFCPERCGWKDCPRNQANIRDRTVPHSFSVEIPQDCPKIKGKDDV